MTRLKKLQAELSSLQCRDNVQCFLLYGSIHYKKQEDINDTDIIIIVDDITCDMDELFGFIYKNFNNPDFHIYTTEEVEEGLSYWTREFILEYLAKALCIYGENILKAKFAQITDQQYKESMLIRSIEYMQRVRRVYYSKIYNQNDKLQYIEKYTVRLAKSILMLYEICNHDDLDRLYGEDVIDLLRANNLLDDEFTLKGATLDVCYQIFCRVGDNLTDCKHKLHPAQY